MSSATDLNQADNARSMIIDNNTHFVAARNNPSGDPLKSDTITSTPESLITTQIAQWVYIQAPPTITMPTQHAVNKTNNPTNILLNTVAPLQLSNISSNNLTNKNVSLSNNNQGMVLHSVNANTTNSSINNNKAPQHLLIQRPSGLPVVSKNALAYLTMIKPQQIGTTSNQKYVIAPMPKLTTNRLPTTVTTNCVQPKIALMPLTLQNTINNTPAPKHKIFNLKITDGQLHNTENNGAIRVMSDGGPGGRNETNTDDNYPKLSSEQLEDKSYELSIVEDSVSKNDVSFTVTIPDDLDKTKTHTQKFSKHHGVSILKKNFNLEPKVERSSHLIISPVANSITTISDSSTKEVKITTATNFSVSEAPVLIENKFASQKSGRRKSTVACRKDFDDFPVKSNTGGSDNKKDDPIVTLTKGSRGSSVPNKMDDVIEVIKEKADINMNEEFDAKKILTWEDGVGTLPGSQIKFQINEFGFLEYLKKDELKQIAEKAVSRPKHKKDEFQEEMRCLQCGCYGMPSEFISPKYCSYDCQESGNKAAKQKEAKMKRRTKALMKKSSESLTSDREVKIEKEEIIISEDEQTTSNENSQDKFNYPWTCAKKGFSWVKYLEHIKAKAAPVKFFKDPFPYNRNGFRPGMKLEGIDPQHPSYFCVLTVAEVIGYRIRLHFDGYTENYDFWLNADSMDIFPAGWCEKYGHVLHPPSGYTTKDFNWTHYLKQTKSTVAPKHLFANRAGSAICPNGFRVGMKLEAVDRKNQSLICVSTVLDMMDNRILVHFESWDDVYDYWADPTSPYIHPVGWCDQNGHNLTPPNDYPKPETFTWETYLKETKSVAAPVRAFKQRPVYAFKRGMRLECVDKRVPQLIRVATVDDVQEHQIRISFDGWPDRYSYWVDNDSPNIHPVGWCQKTGHPIEPPLTPDDVYDFLECPTVGCRGQGHFKGPQFCTHSTTEDCPYSDENMYRSRVMPDRLLSPDRQLEAVVPVSREPRDKSKSKVGRPPKIARRDPPIKIEWNDEESQAVEDVKPLKHKSVRSSKSSVSSSNEQEVKKEIVPLTNGYTSAFAEQIWEKHSKHLNYHIKYRTDPKEWLVDDVVRFVVSLPYCKNLGALFREHKIDGEALLMLSQRDLVEILNIKLGPAIKLYSIIVLLRRNDL